MKLALGTAQFGLPYGIANQIGRVSFGEGGAILRLARSAGIDTIDTAIAYGGSEDRLGEIGVTDWKVISKLPAVPEACPDIAAWVVGSVQGRPTSSVSLPSSGRVSTPLIDATSAPSTRSFASPAVSETRSSTSTQTHRFSGNLRVKLMRTENFYYDFNYFGIFPDQQASNTGITNDCHRFTLM